MLQLNGRPRPAPRPSMLLPLLALITSAALSQTSPPPSSAPKSTSNGPATLSGSGPGDTKAVSDGHASQSPFAPAPPPPKPFTRPRIGLALGGGGALALSEVGVLQWFEEHHIPVDVIAGTSMGCLVSSLYSTGRTPDELKNIVNDRVFTSVFSLSSPYQSRSFRRREDSRELPNGITVGLKHGVSFRNSVLIDQGLDAFLDRQFLRYDDRTDFNTLPIPLRCMTTDLNNARAVTFTRGSIPDAVRASVSLPGVYQPVTILGNQYVDGGVLDNLPTAAVRSMNADVILAVSMPLSPVANGDLNSILGVLQRSFSVAIEAAERQQRTEANVVIMPDISGFTSNDYLKSVALAQRGYDATEKNRDALLKYAISDSDWQAYLAHRAGLDRGPAGPVLRVRVDAPTQSATLAIQRLFAPLVNQPVDTSKIEALLDQVRADGAYDADYTVGYETPQHFAAQVSGAAPIPKDTIPVATITKAEQAAPTTGTVTTPAPPGAPTPKAGTAPTSNQPGVPKTTPANEDASADRPGAPGLAATQPVTPESLANIAARPVILVHVSARKSGPPFLLLGANLETQSGAFTRAYIEGIVVDQNLGGYGSELRTHIKAGYLTELASEYFRPLNPNAPPEHTLFVAPHLDLLREPFPVYQNQTHLADRQYQSLGGGADLGWTNQRTQQLRLGIDIARTHWITSIGSDTLPDIYGNLHRIHLRYDLDTQDRALVPQFGYHVSTEAAYLFSTIDSRNAPVITTRGSYAHRFSLHKAPPPDAKPDPNRGHEVFVIAGEGGTMFNRTVADPFRFTLGGPLRLSASAIDQYRGTDYFLLEPALLRRIASLPAPLGQNIYLGAGLEFGQIRAPLTPNITREDGYFGIVAETPLGVITLAPAIGSNGERKLVFTLGKLF